MRKTSRREVLSTLAIGAVALKAPAIPAIAADNRPPALSGRVVMPQDADYDLARMPWSQYLADHPRAIVFAQDNDSVVSALAWARSLGVPPRARSGRHALAPNMSSVDDGVVIDVSGFKDISVDEAAQTVTLGTGLTQGEVVAKLGETGRGLTTGSEATVGIAGVTLGGGIGYLARSLGPTCDSLIALDLVVADDADGARLIRAGENSHSDLLWACRGGGGGNFGIATSFTFRLHPVKDIVHFKINWDWSDPQAVFEAWQNWAPVTDRRLGCSFVFLPRETNLLEAEGVFVGAEDELSELLAPLVAVGDPKTTLKSTTLADYYQQANAGPRHYYNWRFSSSWIREPLSSAASETIIQFMSDAPTPACNYWCLSWGEATTQAPLRGAAFFHRDALYYAEPGAAWNDLTKTDAAIDWTNAFAKAMRPHVTGAYVNVPDPTFEDAGQLYYGDNLERLREIKRRYDPFNVFRYPQSITPGA